MARALLKAHCGWLSDNALVIIEESADVKLEQQEGFETLDSRGYGGTQILFLRRTLQ
jgi:16S rRNA G966 N2-methylase RsmD